MASAKQLPSGRWRVLLFIGKDASGKRQYKSFTADTRRQAELEAAQYAVEPKEKPKASTMTVGQAIDAYIALRSNVLSPSTVRGYKAYRRNNFQSIMDVHIDALTQEHIQKAVNDDAEDKSPKSIRNAHGLLTPVLKEYLPDFRINTKLPAKAKKEIEVPDQNDIAKLLDATSGHWLYPIIIIASCLGLRRSEICALTWGDVIGERIRINKALVINDVAQWVTKKPKSYSGTRTLDLPDFILKTFPDRNGAGDNDRIFTETPGSITCAFIRFRDNLGMSYRFHDLRHYNASVMLALGVPDKYAMERMGHATPDMLKRVYQHVLKSKREEVSKTVNDYFLTAIKTPCNTKCNTEIQKR